MKKSISIIAGGYLGSRLAIELNHLKHPVKLSFRNNKPKQQVTNIDYHFCDISQGQVTANSALFESDILVICIPPGFKKGLGDFYAHNIKSIVDMATKGGVEQLIFTSSTGIYPKHGIFDEGAQLDLTDHKAKALFEAEQSILASSAKYKQVLRLAGLFGENRHPGQFKLKITADNANQTVNMILIDDVVAAILHLVEQPETPSEIYNLVAPHHPTKQTFYRYFRQQLGLQQNHQSWLTPEINCAYKYVNGDKFCIETGFQYPHSDLFQVTI